MKVSKFLEIHCTLEKCKLNMHIWTSVRIFVRNFVKWWSDKWRYWKYKSFLLNFNFEPEIRILAPESTNCWAWNFLTSQSRIKIKLWDMNLQNPNFLRAEVENPRVCGLWGTAHASWVLKNDQNVALCDEIIFVSLVYQFKTISNENWKCVGVTKIAWVVQKSDFDCFSWFFEL